jgi:hypothetical protein
MVKAWELFIKSVGDLCWYEHKGLHLKILLIRPAAIADQQASKIIASGGL